MNFRRSPRAWLALAAIAPAAIGLAACGSSSSKSTKATPLALTISDSGKTATFSGPTTVKGGLVKVSLQNQGKMQHSLQLVLVEGNHTTAEALKVISSNSDKTPSWIRGEGGTGTINPGQSQTGTVNLPAGNYIVTELGGPGAAAPPAHTTLTVTKGDTGDLPSTPTTITAANPSKDKYKWEINGKLKPGANTVTFDSKGKEAIHFIGAFKVNGNPTQQEIIQGLKSNGPPPKFVDPTSFYTTAILDGGKSQTTSVDLKSPGKYVLFCPLTDRDGGKPHFEEGLITTVQVG